MRAIFTVLCAAIACAASAEEPKAARSVHLWYQAEEGRAFYNEVVVTESQNSSYFMACGFSQGYFGIQQLNNSTNKVAIFSVWDPGSQDDPNSVTDTNRVEVLASGEGVRIKRFGGEGTGGQSLYPFPWQIGETNRFYLEAIPETNKTAYSVYIYEPAKKSWKHMATFRTRSKGQALKGYYSFVEDFRRDGKSPQERRHAQFNNGWVQKLDGTWTPLETVTFTADSTPLLNINSGTTPAGFFLETGGAVTNHVPLKSKINRPAITIPRPEDLPAKNGK